MFMSSNDPMEKAIATKSKNRPPESNRRAACFTARENFGNLAGKLFLQFGGQHFFQIQLFRLGHDF
jgi:hypothetical protein